MYTFVHFSPTHTRSSTMPETCVSRVSRTATEKEFAKSNNRAKFYERIRSIMTSRYFRKFQRRMNSADPFSDFHPRPSSIRLGHLRWNSASPGCCGVQRDYVHKSGIDTFWSGTGAAPFHYFFRSIISIPKYRIDSRTDRWLTIDSFKADTSQGKMIFLELGRSILTNFLILYVSPYGRLRASFS